VEMRAGGLMFLKVMFFNMPPLRVFASTLVLPIHREISRFDSSDAEVCQRLRCGIYALSAIKKPARAIRGPVS